MGGKVAGEPTESSVAAQEGALSSDQEAPSEAPDSGHDSERPNEDLFRLFVGPNAEKFLKIYRAQRENKHVTSFNWVVLLAALPWFFYRKLYVVGACVLLLPIILVVIFPDLSGVGTTGFGVALALTANTVYVYIARRRIKKLKALNLPPAERDQRISKAGGTSPAGAVFGTLIVVCLIAILLIDQATAKLPDCNNEQVQRMAKSMLTDILSKGGIDAEALALSDFKSIDSAEDGSRHLCSFSANLGTENSAMFASVTWTDSTSEEFQVSIGSTPEGVLQ
jgi:hypothetical protein